MDEYILKTAPTTEPLALSLVKDHLKIPQSQTIEDTLLNSLILAAREQAEIETRRALMPQTWIARLDDFPHDGEIVLPFPPIRSVTSVKYYDGAGSLTTIDAATYQVTGLPIAGALSDGIASISLQYNQYWPDVQQDRRGAVLVEFVAGYDSADVIPGSIKQAMLLMIGHWYTNKEDTVVGTIVSSIPRGASSLLWAYRDLRF